MSTTWTRYYDAAGEQPRETLLFALERFAAEAGAKKGGLFAVDLGCGTTWYSSTALLAVGCQMPVPPANGIDPGA